MNTRYNVEQIGVKLFFTCGEILMWGQPPSGCPIERSMVF